MELKVLQTDRLILRKIEETDVDDIFEYLSDDEVTKYLGKESLITKDEALEIVNKINKNIEYGRSIRWGIALKGSNKLIGTMGYDGYHEKNKRADIGYDLNSNYWRQGIATEAISEVLRYGFEDLNLKRVGAYIFPQNLPSLNMVKKLGFEEEGVLRNFIQQNEKSNDVIVLSLIR